MADQNFSVGVDANLSGFERGFNNAIGLLGRFATQAGLSGQSVAQAVGRINGGNFSPIQRGLDSVVSGFNAISERAKFAGFQVAYYATNANSLLTDAYKRADKEQAKFDAGLGRLGNNISSVGRSLSAYLTAPLIAAGIAAFGTYAKIDSLNRALTVIEGPTGNAAARFKELREVSALPGLGLEAAVQGDVRLRAVGLSAQLSKASLLEFGNAIALTGGGKAELGSVTTQLGQMAAKGKVLAQDLRPIIEAAPAVAQSIKKIFGTIDSEEISSKLAATGKSSTDFIQLITSEMAKLERVSGGPKNAIENIGDALKIASYQFVGAADKILGLTNKLDNLSGFIGSVANRFSEMNPAAQTAILGLVGAAAAAGPLALGLGTIINLIPTITTGFKAMQTAMLAISGPVGIIAGAIAVVGALTYAMVQFNTTATYTIDRSKLLADVTKSVNDQVGAEKANLESLIAVARDETISKEARANAIRKINAIAPEYLGNITAETIDTTNATAAIERYTKVLSLKALAQVLAQRQGEALANETKAGATSAKEFANSWSDVVAATIKGVVVGGGVVDPDSYLREKGLERQRAAIVNAHKEAELYGNELNRVNKQLASIEIKPPTVSVGNTIDFTKVGQAAGIKKAKDEMKALAEQIQSGNLAGQDTSALQAKYDTLAASIDKATESTRKHKKGQQEVTKEVTGLQVLQSIYNRLGTEIQQFAIKGEQAPQALRAQWAALGQEIESAKNALKRVELPDITKLTGKATSNVSLNARLGISDVSDLPKRLRSRIAELPAIEADLKMQARFDVIDREKTFSMLQADLSTALASMPGFVQKMAGDLGAQLGVAFGSGQVLDPFNNAINAIVTSFGQAKQGLAQGMMGVFESLGQAVGSGGNILATLLKGVLDMIGNYLITTGTALVTSALLLETNPFTAVFGTAQGIQGAAMIAGGGLVKGLGSVLKFAKGGVFDQPTFGLFGEYAGAGSGNPEIATPQKIMRQTFEGVLQNQSFAQARPVQGGVSVQQVPYFVTIGSKVGELYAEIERHKQGLDDFNGN